MAVEFDLAYFRSEECRQGIIEQARNIIEKEPTSFDLEILAQKTGLPRAVVNHHFNNLESLRNSILEDFFYQFFPRVLERYVARLERSKHVISDLDLVIMFLDTLKVMIQEKGGYFRADMAGMAERPHQANWSFFIRALDRYFLMLEEIIRHGRGSGLFDEKLTVSSARDFLHWLFLGSTLQSLYFQNDLDPSYLFEQAKEQARVLLCADRFDWRMMTD